MTAPDYGIVVPADWWRVDLTAGDRGAAGVRGLVRRLAGGADEQALLRRELVEHLDAACRDAVGRGGVDLYLATGGPAGTLIAASLLVTVTGRQAGAGDTVSAVAAAFADGGQTTVVEVGGRRAVRRTRHDLPGDLPVDGRPSLVVQYAFVMPEVVVMMSFSTPVLALAEPLTALFDAVAETFRWSEGAA